MSKHSFDSKCFDLARDFLDEEIWFQAESESERGEIADALARQIQDTIEDFIDTKGEFR